MKTSRSREKWRVEYRALQNGVHACMVTLALAIAMAFVA